MNHRWLACMCFIGIVPVWQSGAQDSAAGTPVKALDDPAFGPTQTLPQIKALIDHRKISPSFTADHLLLPDGPVLDGDFKCSGLRMNGEAIALENVAALVGGAGQGRSAKVYFRDGTVRTGELTFKECSFVSKALGRLNITPTSLDHVILRRSSKDGRPDAAIAGYMLNDDGAIRALLSLPETPLRLRWLGGELKVPWNQISRIRPRPLPEIAHEVHVNGGTRIVAWVFPPADPGPFLAFARNLVALHDTSEVSVAGLTQSMVHTRDRSQWQGKWAREAIQFNAAGATVSVRTADIASIVVVSDAEDGTALAMRTGAIVRGRVLDETLAWETPVGLITLPWRLIDRIGGFDK